jgi:hypothetical protein
MGRGVYRVLMGKPEGKRPLRKSKCRRKWDVGVWTGLGWLKIETMVGTCECDMNLRVP